MKKRNFFYDHRHRERRPYDDIEITLLFNVLLKFFLYVCVCVVAVLSILSWLSNRPAFTIGTVLDSCIEGREAGEMRGASCL